MPFKNANTAVKLPVKDNFQAGVSNTDNGSTSIERGVLIPWASDVQASWLYAECVVGVMLDSGIVVHNRLPQVDNGYDTIGVASVDDPNLDRITGNGINLRCLDQYQDIVQRMGHARYWFRLWGQALRVGYQVPIPTINTIGGVPAIPYDNNPQWGYNRIAGNYSGVPLWHAQWSLWFTTAVPSVGGVPPAVNPAEHISDTTALPNDIQAPYSQPDDNAQSRTPAQVVTNSSRRANPNR